MKIAVVGSGISGLSAAYYLSKKHNVDLFEREDHFGGHSYTIDLPLHGKKVSIDIGFIVFNFQTYPNLINFFQENDVEIEKSDMSFSVSVDNTNFEYCGKGLGGIFSNKSNLFNIKFLKMFFDIIKFYKKSDQIYISKDKITSEVVVLAEKIASKSTMTVATGKKALPSGAGPGEPCPPSLLTTI